MTFVLRHNFWTYLTYTLPLARPCLGYPIHHDLSCFTSVVGHPGHCTCLDWKVPSRSFRYSESTNRCPGVSWIKRPSRADAPASQYLDSRTSLGMDFSQFGTRVGSILTPVSAGDTAIPKIRIFCSGETHYSPSWFDLAFVSLVSCIYALSPAECYCSTESPI